MIVQTTTRTRTKTKSKSRVFHLRHICANESDALIQALHSANQDKKNYVPTREASPAITSEHRPFGSLGVGDIHRIPVTDSDFGKSDEEHDSKGEEKGWKNKKCATKADREFASKPRTTTFTGTGGTGSIPLNSPPKRRRGRPSKHRG